MEMESSSIRVDSSVKGYHTIYMKNVWYGAGTVLVIVVSLFLIKIFDISYPLDIVTTTRSTELSVIGEGQVEAIPDTAYVDAGITVANGQSVDAVQKQIDDVNNKIIQNVSALGIKKADIKTSNYSINPEYNFNTNQRTISGYTGNATVKVTVKDRSLLSEVVSGVTDAGANQINGIRYEVKNPETYREEARNKAIQNAKDQAQKLAAELGIKLGKITNIVESSPSSPTLYPVARAVSLNSAGSGPELEPGSQTISSVVTLYFEKK